MTSPQVSVIMPVYNEEKYVSFALESILNQTFGDFELIIIDGGSTDKSVNKIKSFGDSRVKLIQTDHSSGIAKDLNIGFDRARGRYIARMDADDIAHPKRLQAQVDFLNSNPDKLVVGSSMYLIDTNNRIISKKDVEKHPKLDTKSILHRGVPTPHPSVMMRRHAIDRVGGYRPIFKKAQDLDFWLRLSEVSHADSMYNMPNRYLYYRIDGGQLLNQTSDNSVFAEVARDAARLRQSGQDELRALNRLQHIEPEYLQQQSPNIQAAYRQYSQFRRYYMAGNYLTALGSLAKTEPNMTSIRILIRLLIRDMKIKFRR